MPEDAKPVPPADSSTPRPAPGAQSDSDRAHVPMTEEFDSPKWTLPPIVPVVIAIAAIVIVIVIVAVVSRPAQHFGGSITKVVASDQQGSVMVAVQVKIDNLTERQQKIRSISSELQTADGKTYPDSAPSFTDIDRYLKAVPALQEAKADPLREELKIPPKSSFTGMTVFAYPVDKAGFDTRKQLTMRIEIYGEPTLVLKQ